MRHSFVIRSVASPFGISDRRLTNINLRVGSNETAEDSDQLTLSSPITPLDSIVVRNLPLELNDNERLAILLRCSWKKDVTVLAVLNPQGTSETMSFSSEHALDLSTGQSIEISVMLVAESGLSARTLERRHLVVVLPQDGPEVNQVWTSEKQFLELGLPKGTKWYVEDIEFDFEQSVTVLLHEKLRSTLLEGTEAEKRLLAEEITTSVLLSALFLWKERGFPDEERSLGKAMANLCQSLDIDATRIVSANIRQLNAKLQDFVGGKA